VNIFFGFNNDRKDTCFEINTIFYRSGGKIVDERKRDGNEKV